MSRVVAVYLGSDGAHYGNIPAHDLTEEDVAILGDEQLATLHVQHYADGGPVLYRLRKGAKEPAREAAIRLGRVDADAPEDVEPEDDDEDTSGPARPARATASSRAASSSSSADTDTSGASRSAPSPRSGSSTAGGDATKTADADGADASTKGGQ